MRTPAVGRADEATQQDQGVRPIRCSIKYSPDSTLLDYDALGNDVRYFDAGDGGANDDVNAFIAYSSTEPTCAERHIVGVALGIDVIGDGALMRSRRSAIDCASGNVAQVSRGLANGQAAVTDLGYDAYGSGRVAA